MLVIVYNIHGNNLAAVHYVAYGNYVVEVKTRRVINKTLTNSVNS